MKNLQHNLLLKIVGQSLRRIVLSHMGAWKLKTLYFDEHRKFHEQDWDVRKGLIRRSKKGDPRNNGNQLNYTSIVMDAVKPSS